MSENVRFSLFMSALVIVAAALAGGLYMAVSSDFAHAAYAVHPVLSQLALLVVCIVSVATLFRTLAWVMDKGFI